MIDTNALLAFALTIISNFTQVVYVPPGAVPRGTNDFAWSRIGMFSEPLTIAVGHRKGTGFWIRNGAVWMYATPRRFFGIEDPKRIPAFLGPARLDTNQVIELASSTVRRLVKTGDPLRDVAPLLRPAGNYEGQVIPFYRVVWCHPDLDSAATVEIDARDGMIVSLSLHDDGFCDPAYAAQISNQVFRPSPPKPPPKRIGRCPATKEVLPAIENWLKFCHRLGINPGPQTTFRDVNWDKSWTLESTNFPLGKHLCCITFSNSTCFQCVDGVVYNHASWDCFFGDDYGQRWRGQFPRFEGTIKYRWEDLARRLERRISAEFAVPPATLAQYRSELQHTPPQVGAQGRARVDVYWFDALRHPVGPTLNVMPDMMAEFDLRTGEIKQFGFRGAGLFAAVRCSGVQGR